MTQIVLAFAETAVVSTLVAINMLNTAKSERLSAATTVSESVFTSVLVANIRLNDTATTTSKLKG